MRLLNIATLQLEEFFGKAPPYAILSHTWAEGEVTFQDIQALGDLEARKAVIYGPADDRKAGFDKLRFCCLEASDAEFKYVWIDTCCIDKSSSAELSEAINSMFEWYRRAETCYALLDEPNLDVSGVHELGIHDLFTNSRWFRRGWTLQELIAPHSMEFYVRDPVKYPQNVLKLGSRGGFSTQIAAATHIDPALFREDRLPDSMQRKQLHDYSIAQRLSWAADRQTTRIEDRAYSLLGIFDVNMPLLYGEGAKAFQRLQEEIVRVSTDQSIFAWNFSAPPTSANTFLELERGTSYSLFPKDNYHDLFAPYLECFRACEGIVCWARDDEKPSTLSNRGLHTGLKIAGYRALPFRDVALLNCCFQDRPNGLIGLLVGMADGKPLWELDSAVESLLYISPSDKQRTQVVAFDNLRRSIFSDVILLRTTDGPTNNDYSPFRFRLQDRLPLNILSTSSTEDNVATPFEVWPHEKWDWRSQSLVGSSGVLVFAKTDNENRYVAAASRVMIAFGSVTSGHWIKCIRAEGLQMRPTWQTCLKSALPKPRHVTVADHLCVPDHYHCHVSLTSVEYNDKITGQISVELRAINGVDHVKSGHCNGTSDPPAKSSDALSSHPQALPADTTSGASFWRQKLKVLKKH